MKKFAPVFFIAAFFCACRTESLNNKMMGVWAFAGSDNASFVIEKDSIYYPGSFTSFKYLLVKDSIKIEYEGNAESFFVKMKGPDTLILKGDKEQVYYRFRDSRGDH